MVTIPPRRVRLALTIGQLGGGGGERQAALLVEHLDPERFDTEVICFTRGGRWADYLAGRGFRITVIPRRGHHDLSRHVRLLDLFLRTRPHVLLCEMSDAHVYATPAAVAAGVCGIAVGYRTVDFEWSRLRRACERALVPWVDVLLANAGAVARSVTRSLGVSERRVWTVYNALDFAAFERPDRRAARALLGIGEEEFAVGFVASFSPEKHHDTAVRALARLREARPSVRIVFVGDGPRLAAARELAAQLGVADRCRFAGFRDDVPAILPAFDVTVNCSRREGCCNAIVESLAAGVPVVATAVGGNVELVGDGERGRLFAVDDDGALAEHLAQAAAGAWDLAALGGEGRRYVRSRFRVEDHVREMERLVLALAARPRRLPFAPRGPALKQNGPPEVPAAHS